MADLETSKKQSAQRQTEQAIAHFRKGQLDCAITLAAAAEGALPNTDDPHLFKAFRDHKSFEELEHNLFINWLKHSGGPDLPLSFSSTEI